MKSPEVSKQSKDDLECESCGTCEVHYLQCGTVPSRRGKEGRRMETDALTEGSSAEMLSSVSNSNAQEALLLVCALPHQQ